MFIVWDRKKILLSEIKFFFLLYKPTPTRVSTFLNTPITSIFLNFRSTKAHHIFFIKVFIPYSCILKSTQISVFFLFHLFLINFVIKISVTTNYAIFLFASLIHFFFSSSCFIFTQNIFNNFFTNFHFQSLFFFYFLSYRNLYLDLYIRV